MTEQPVRANPFWWVLWGLLLAAGTVALYAAATSNYRQWSAVSAVEDLGGIISLQSIAPDWARDPAADYMMRGSNRVVRVQLSRARMTPAEIAQLVDAVASFHRLRTLRVASSPVGDAELAQIAALPELSAVDLNRTPVTDAGMKHLAALASLDWLILDNTAVTDDGVRVLASAVKLKMLSLEQTAVTDDGLLELAKLPSLDTVYLIGTGVTDEGVAEFQRRCPGVRVFR
jgi:hypothetical protein